MGDKRVLKPGLVSITFRNLAPLDIVRLVKQAGMTGIEWGGDVHVPHGDLKAAREVAGLTADAGLQVAAYGSYYRLGQVNDIEFAAILDTAVQLGAPTIRVWAGRRASADADGPYRAKVIGEAQNAAELAASAGTTISLEYHGGTLTDTNASALEFLNEVAYHAVKTYWQPPVGGSVDYCSAGLISVIPWLTNVHVFHWHPANERFALATGVEEWLRYLGLIRSTGRDHYAMIEFVKDDLPVNFLSDASTLLSWLAV
jgi:3-dehydroshikimate dehydratase